MIIPDVNLLTYAHDDDALEHIAARRWWDGLLHGAESVGLAWVVVTGFVRQITHPRIVYEPLPPDTAMAIVDQWFELPHVFPLNPGNEHLKLFRHCIDAVGVGGNLVTDCHIAALAMEYDAEVHSNDSDFARFPGLSWRNPL